jgi:hypothetical protein
MLLARPLYHCVYYSSEALMSRQINVRDPRPYTVEASSDLEQGLLTEILFYLTQWRPLLTFKKDLMTEILGLSYTVEASPDLEQGLITEALLHSVGLS